MKFRLPRALRATSLAVMSAALILVVSAFAHRSAPAVTYAAWLEAISTLAAFSAAIAAVMYAIEAYRLESSREDARLRSEDRAQAGLVAAWWGLADVRYTRFNQPQHVAQESRLVVRNASEVPVTNVQVHLAVNGVDAPNLVIPTLGPGVDPVPLEIPEFAEAQRLFELTRGIARDGMPEIKIGITFTDAEGRHWNRAPSGRLERIEDNAPVDMSWRPGR